MTETCQAKFPGVARDCCGQWNPRRKQLMFSTGELAQMADLSGLPRGIRPNELEAFVALVAERAAAAERNACKAAVWSVLMDPTSSEQYLLGANACFDRLRARDPL